MRGMSPLLVDEGVRRDAFLATLGSRTWRARASAASVLADPDAVSGRAAYAAGLHRRAAPWARLPPPPRPRGPPRPGDQPWPLLSVGPDCLGGHDQLAADLADLGGNAEVLRRQGGVDEAF